MSWVDMLPHNSLITLLEKHFFPRWLQVLGTWLSGPNPNYYEVTSWYQGWKTLFPQQLLSDSTVKGNGDVYLCNLVSVVNCMSHAISFIPVFLLLTHVTLYVSDHFCRFATSICHSITVSLVF